VETFSPAHGADAGAASGVTSGAAPGAAARAGGGAGYSAAALRQLDHCNKCGFCLPACPTFIETGLEMASPRGRLAIAEEVMAGRMPLSDYVAQHMYLCLGCRACEVACPSGVEYDRVLMDTRHLLNRAGIEAPGSRGLPRFLLNTVADPDRLRLLKAAVRAAEALGLRSLARRPAIRRLLPARLRDLESMLPDQAEQVRALKAPQTPNGGSAAGTGSAATAPAAEAAAGTAAASTPAVTVAFFPGCVQEALFQGTNARTVRVLEHFGARVVPAPGFGCCGALHGHSGDLHRARELARRNIEAFERSGARYLVNNAGGCGAFLKEYPRLFEDDPDWLPRAEAFAARVRDASEMLLELPGPPGWQGVRPTSGGPAAGSGPRLVVTYQDSCHLRNVQRVWRQPRDILSRLPGVRYVELPGADQCCGSAGIYNVTHPDMSLAILDRKMDGVKAVNPDVIVVANPGCQMQMLLGVDRHGLGGKVRVMHLIDLVAEQLGL